MEKEGRERRAREGELVRGETGPAAFPSSTTTSFSPDDPLLPLIHQSAGY